MATTTSKHMRAGGKSQKSPLDLHHQIILWMALDPFNRLPRHRRAHRLKEIKGDEAGAMNEVVEDDSRLIRAVGGGTEVEIISGEEDGKVDVSKLERLAWCERRLGISNITSH